MKKHEEDEKQKRFDAIRLAQQQTEKQETEKRRKEEEEKKRIEEEKAKSAKTVDPFAAFGSGDGDPFASGFDSK